jgi:hypothetical protein
VAEVSEVPQKQESGVGSQESGVGSRSRSQESGVGSRSRSQESGVGSQELGPASGARSQAAAFNRIGVELRRFVELEMNRNYQILLACCLATIAALLVVGSVSSGVIRHIVQTAPLWIVIALAARQSGWSKWAAVPCFMFWLLIMVAIWLFLLGWAHIVSGSFTRTEVAMTVVVAFASIVGLVGALSLKTNMRVLQAIAGMALVLALQLGAFRLSLIPQIAHR